MGLFDINPALPNPSESPDTTTPPILQTASSTFGVTAAARSILGSIYNSLQTTLRLQNWHGLDLAVGPTRECTRSTMKPAFCPMPRKDPLSDEKAEYGNSDYDVRNTFTGYFNYAIPAFHGPERLTHGWELNSGFSFHGGTPYTVVASSNVSGNGDNADRAVQVLQNPNQRASRMPSSRAQFSGSVRTPLSILHPEPTLQHVVGRTITPVIAPSTWLFSRRHRHHRKGEDSNQVPRQYV